MNIRLCPLFALLAAASAAQAAPPINPGLWEITVESEMAGMPMKMPPAKRQECISPQEAQTGGKTVPQDPQHGCKTAGAKFVGNTAHWTVRCEGMSGRGTMAYNGDSYQGTMVMDIAGDGEGMKMTQKIAGRRLGDCKP